MAIDGTGILDSDMAADIYNHVAEFHEEGLKGDDIRRMIEPFVAANSTDPLYEEISVAALVLALWESGHLDDETLGRLHHIIESGQSSAEWEELGPDWITGRREALKVLLNRVARKPLRPHAKKKSVDQLLYLGDILVDKTADDVAFVTIEVSGRGARRRYGFLIVLKCLDGMEKSQFLAVRRPGILGKTGVCVRTVGLDETSLLSHPGQWRISGSVDIDLSRLEVTLRSVVQFPLQLVEDVRRCVEDAEIWSLYEEPLSTLMR